MALSLLNLSTTMMNTECDHCGQTIVGKSYRVTSEDRGIRLLDMTVCYYCFVEARRLGLSAEDVSERSSTSGHRAHA